MERNLQQLDLMYMLFESHSRSEKREFNNLTSFGGIIDFFNQRGVSFGKMEADYC